VIFDVLPKIIILSFYSLKEISVFLDVNSKHTCFLKQKHKNGIAAIRDIIEMDVPKNVQMSQVEGVDVLCDGNVPGDIKKTQLRFE